MALDTGTVSINIWTTLERQACINCGLQFAVDARWDAERRRDHKDFYCPNGHQQHYTGQTEAERLRAQLDRAYDAQSQTRQALANERKSHAATKGKLTKANKRAAFGVCLYCPRTFRNVQRHISNMHGDQ